MGSAKEVVHVRSPCPRSSEAHVSREPGRSRRLPGEPLGAEVGERVQGTEEPVGRNAEPGMLMVCLC